MKFSYLNPVMPATAAALLSLTFSQAQAQSFADDFSTNSVVRGYTVYTNALANEDTVATADGNGLLLTLEHNDPTGEERAAFEVASDNVKDAISAVVEFTGERPTVGNLRLETFTRLYNKTADGGPVPDERTDDVEADVNLRLGTAPEEDLAEACFRQRDADGNSSNIDGIDNRCFLFQITELEVNTPYTVTVGFDRETNELYGQLNDERIAIMSPHTIFEPARPQAYTRARVRDGAQSGEFRISDVMFDGTPVDISNYNDTNNYRHDGFDDFTGDENRSKEIVDGRLRLSSSASNAEDNSDSFLRFAKPSTFIQADMVFSSESEIDTTGADLEGETGAAFGAVRIAGIQYNELSADSDAGNLGSVWGAVMLIDHAATGLVAEYCVIRSDADDFSASTDLGDGMDDDQCPKFDLSVEKDVVYNASIDLDTEAKTLTFQLGGEEKIYNIETDILLRENDSLRAQAVMRRGATGTIVGYFDNLRNDPDALTSEEMTATATGDDSAGDSDSAESSSGGGGCSVVQGQKEYSMLWLLLGALGVIGFRAVRRRV